MTKITFEEVAFHASKSGKCGCGKHCKRQRKFWATLNPFNRNAVGAPKTRVEIYDDLRTQAAVWKTEPIVCTSCGDATQ